MVHQIVVLVTPEEFSPVIHSPSRWTWTPTVWNISQSTFNYSILTRHYILIYQLFNRGDILFLKTQILLRTNLKKDYRKITTQIIFTSAGEVFVFVVCQQDFTKKKNYRTDFSEQHYYSGRGCQTAGSSSSRATGYFTPADISRCFCGDQNTFLHKS